MDRKEPRERTGNGNNSLIPMNQFANVKLLIARLNIGKKQKLSGEASGNLHIDKVADMLVKRYIHSFVVIV